jgi:nucleotide-binding universal stress UspA family protein
MARTILLPLDGSPDAEAALQPGAEIAWRLGARLLLTQALDARARPAVRFPTDPAADHTSPAAEAHELLSCRTARVRSYLQACAARVHARFPMLRVGASVPVGPLPEAIIDEAQLERADIVVCAMRLGNDPAGTGYALPDRQAGVGRAAEALARRAGIPVLLVPPTAPVVGDRRSSNRPPRILAPLSGSPAAEAVLPFVVQIAGRLDARVTVLHVIAAHEHPGGAAATGTRGRYLTWTTAAGYCQEVAAWLEQHGVPAQVELRAGTPVEEIAIAALSGADMVALGLEDAPAWSEPYRWRQTVHAVGRCGVPVLLFYSRRASSILAPAPAPDSTASTAGTVGTPGGVPADSRLPVGR